MTTEFKPNNEIPIEGYEPAIRYYCIEALEDFPILVKGVFYYLNEEETSKIENKKAFIREDYKLQLYVNNSDISKHLKFVEPFILTNEIKTYLKETLNSKEYHIIKQTLILYNAIYISRDVVDTDTERVFPVVREELFLDSKTNFEKIKKYLKNHKKFDKISRSKYLEILVLIK